MANENVIERVRKALVIAVANNTTVGDISDYDHPIGRSLTCDEADQLALALFLLGEEGKAASILAVHCEMDYPDDHEAHLRIAAENLATRTESARGYLEAMEEYSREPAES